MCDITEIGSTLAAGTWKHSKTNLFKLYFSSAYIDKYSYQFSHAIKNSFPSTIKQTKKGAKPEIVSVFK